MRKPSGGQLVNTPGATGESPPLEPRVVSLQLLFFALGRDNYQCTNGVHQTTREAMATKRRDDEKRQFQKLVEAYRNRRGTVRETNASRRRAEETRKKTQQDLQVVYNQFEEVRFMLCRLSKKWRAISLFFLTGPNNYIKPRLSSW